MTKSFLSVLSVIAILVPWQINASERIEIDDVLVKVCAEDFIATHGKKPCKLFKQNEDTLSASKWWKAPVREVKTDTVKGRTQFYAANKKAKTGTMYHTVKVGDVTYTSKHPMKKSSNFAQAKFKRID